MGIKKIIQNKLKERLDVNVDGKVNGKDFIEAIKNHIDVNNDKEISIDEIIIAVSEAYYKTKILK